MEKPPVRLVNEQLSVITNFMRLTLSHDPEVRRALQESSGFNEDVRPQEAGPMTLRELRGEKERIISGAFSQAALQRAFDAHKRTVPNYNGLSKEKQGKVRDMWDPPSFSSSSGMTPEGKERRPSWLGRILEAIVNALMSKHKQNLSLDNV